MPERQRDVVITGLGAVCALGCDCATLWAGVEEGRAGITSIRRFDTGGFSVHTGATVEAWSHPQPAGRELTEALCRRFAETAAREALCQAAGNGPPLRGDRVALVFGTGIADLEQTVHVIAEDTASALALNGPRITVSTACSSSTSAIGFARDLLAMDAADVVVAGGADVLTPEVFAGFHALGVLSPAKCAPFSTPTGTTLGEGAGFLVLERAEHATARGAPVIASLAGYGLSGDGWHETSPDPKGAGVERAVRAALADASLAAEAIGYVNVHGSGTEANDHTEWLGLKRALGTHSAAVPVSSTKGAIGHAQGAAGVLEAIVTLLAMQQDKIPPTLNFLQPRLQAPPDPVPASAPRPSVWEHALALNSAFGGSNAALVLSRAHRRSPKRNAQAVAVLGTGMVGPLGQGTRAFGEWDRGISHDDRPDRRVPEFRIEELVPNADPRGLDPASRFLTAAAALALRDAGVTVRGALRDRAGLIAGQLRGSASSIVAFQRSIEERGLMNLSPAAFARIVLNAPAGFCSKLLSLRGPLSAVTTGAGSGLTAIVLAAEILATRGDVDLMIAGGCDEHEPVALERATPGDEGAACLLLGNQCGAVHSPRGAQAWIAGAAIAGPSQLATAVGRATGWRARDESTPEFRAEDSSGGKGCASAIAMIAAVNALGEGRACRALVTSDRGRSVSVAILLTAADGAT